MTKESRYELQKIDCNCNDCGFLKRDVQKYEQFLLKDKELDLWLFENKKTRAIEKAKKKIQQGQKEKGEIALAAALAMKYAYQAYPIPQLYGHCNKFHKEVTFSPNICQLETQECFVHRKDMAHIKPELGFFNHN